MTTPGLRLRWSRRGQPLLATAVVGTGASVPLLAAAVATRLAVSPSLRVAHASGWLLVIGDASELPWADGVVYLGDEAGLLVPTLDEPFPGAAFLALALPPAPLRVLLPDVVIDTRFPARPPDVSQLAELR